MIFTSFVVETLLRVVSLKITRDCLVPVQRRRFNSSARDLGCSVRKLRLSFAGYKVDAYVPYDVTVFSYRESVRRHRRGVISGGNSYRYSLILLTVLVPACHTPLHMFRFHVSIPNQIPYQACPSRRIGFGPWVLAVLYAREIVKRCNFDGMLLILRRFL